MAVRVITRLTLAVSALVVVAACGGSEAEPAGETSTTTTTPVPTTRLTTTTTVAPTSTTSMPAPPTTLKVTYVDQPGVTTVLDSFDAATGGVAADLEGNVYFADIGQAPSRLGTRVFKLDTEGAVSVVADSEQLRGASGIHVTADGTIYQSAFTAGSVSKITPDGTITEVANEGLAGPIGVTVDSDTGVVWVADCRGSRIVNVSADGTTSTLTDDPLLNCPNGITLADDGNAYVANFRNGDVLRVTPDGEVTTLTTLPTSNLGHLDFGDGRLVVAARGAGQLYEVSLDGSFQLLAGTGDTEMSDGQLLEAGIFFPNGVAIAPDGAIWINQPAVSTGANLPIALRRVVID